MPSNQTPRFANRFNSNKNRDKLNFSSSTSLRENPRATSSKENNSGLKNESSTIVYKIVKNIFEEYCTIGNTDDFLDLIKLRFPGM